MKTINAILVDPFVELIEPVTIQMEDGEDGPRPVEQSLLLHLDSEGTEWHYVEPGTLMICPNDYEPPPNGERTWASYKRFMPIECRFLLVGSNGDHLIDTTVTVEDLEKQIAFFPTPQLAWAFTVHSLKEKA